ncbi:acyl-CoA dehydrogenase family protein [Acinetobacter sp. ANC 5502]
MTNLTIQHAQAFSESQIYAAWGQGPSSRYDELAQHFRPVFAKIQAGTLQREQQRILPYEQLQWLKDSGFTRLRLPKAFGGFDASIPELFALLVELAQADSNLPQVLRVHFGFTEDVLISQDPAFKARWLKRIAAGETIGSAWSEGGKESRDQFQTHMYRDPQGRLRLKGQKYYTTGSLYADWIEVGIQDLTGESASVLVPRHSEGVAVLDDWNGFGQKLTASGTAIFNDVLIDPSEILVDGTRFKYSAAYYQLVQLAIITGLGRAASYELSHAVEQRTYLAALQGNAEYEEQQNALAELETAQSQTVITQLILNASTVLFDALGASASDQRYALDRFWRNVRTLSSHNPRVFKDRIVGDFSVNGTLPPYQWRIGDVSQDQALPKAS